MSRDEAIEFLYDLLDITDYNMKHKEAVEYAVNAIEKETMCNEILNELKSTPVLRGEWEVVHGVLTPGGDPLLRCPFCKSKESHHMGGIEFPQDWNYCPKCGTKFV